MTDALCYIIVQRFSGFNQDCNDSLDTLSLDKKINLNDCGEYIFGEKEEGEYKSKANRLQISKKR